MTRKYRSAYDASHALVIGINAYQHAGPLTFAVNDARGVARALVEACGFARESVRLLEDAQATRDGILHAYMDLRTQLRPDDRLVVFFAGHGHTEPGRKGDVGYLVPVDGRSGKLPTLIRWQELTDGADVLDAKHILFIMDACYSGLALQRAEAGSSRLVGDLVSRSAIQVITAGKADQLVADGGGVRPGHSLFTAHLLDALEGVAMAQEPVLTASRILSHVIARVGGDPRSRQTPHGGTLEGDGDMVFRPGLGGADDLTAAEEAAPTMRPPGPVGPAASVGDDIARRFRWFLHLINAGRDAADQFTLPQLAEHLGHPDWRRLEAIATGAGDASIAELRTLAEGLGVNPDWLINGRANPFDTDAELPDADGQFEAIRAAQPRRVVVFRETEGRFSAGVAMQLDDLRWRTFGYHHPVTPEVGGTGRHQLLDFCRLLRRLHRHFWKAPGDVTGLEVSREEFEDLLCGSIHPGSVLDQLRHDHWWQDFAELAEHRVTGARPADQTLREAIRLTRTVLADQQARARTVPWLRARLEDAGFPAVPDRKAALFDMDPPDRPPADVDTSWPRIAALELVAAKFSFSAAHDRTLLDGRCDLDLHNRAKVPLSDCRIFVDSLELDGTAETVGRNLRTRTGHRLAPDAMQRLPLCTRDLKDIISRPPWLLLLEDETRPLFDGRRYVLNLELRSSYEHPTRVRLELRIGARKDVAAAILGQTV